MPVPIADSANAGFDFPEGLKPNLRKPALATHRLPRRTGT
jgi:hypothetical protein